MLCWQCHTHSQYTSSLFWRVVLKSKQPINLFWKSNPCLSVNPAGWQSGLSGLAHHIPNSPLAFMQISRNVDGLVECVCLCVYVLNWMTSDYLTTRLFTPLFIIFLCSLFLHFCPLLCLSSRHGFPNVKWQQRQRQTAWCTFLMGGFYILTSLPFLFLNLVQWGEKMRRQMEEKNINKLHLNWSVFLV